MLVAALAMSLAPAASGSAASLCSEGSAMGQCSQPQGLAVDTETGRTYVADEGNDRIDVFDEAGAFLSSFGEGTLSASDLGRGRQWRRARAPTMTSSRSTSVTKPPNGGSPTSTPRACSRTR